MQHKRKYFCSFLQCLCFSSNSCKKGFGSAASFEVAIVVKNNSPVEREEFRFPIFTIFRDEKVFRVK